MTIQKSFSSFTFIGFSTTINGTEKATDKSLKSSLASSFVSLEIFVTTAEYSDIRA